MQMKVDVCALVSCCVALMSRTCDSNATHDTLCYDAMMPPVRDGAAIACLAIKQSTMLLQCTLFFACARLHVLCCARTCTCVCSVAELQMMCSLNYDVLHACASSSSARASCNSAHDDAMLAAAQLVVRAHACAHVPAMWHNYTKLATTTLQCGTHVAHHHNIV